MTRAERLAETLLRVRERIGKLPPGARPRYGRASGLQPAQAKWLVQWQPTDNPLRDARLLLAARAICKQHLHAGVLDTTRLLSIADPFAPVCRAPAVRERKRRTPQKAGTVAGPAKPVD